MEVPFASNGKKRLKEARRLPDAAPLLYCAGATGGRSNVKAEIFSRGVSIRALLKRRSIEPIPGDVDEIPLSDLLRRTQARRAVAAGIRCARQRVGRLRRNDARKRPLRHLECAAAGSDREVAAPPGRPCFRDGWPVCRDQGAAWRFHTDRGEGSG